MRCYVSVFMQTCYWLVPADPYRSILQETIRRLAAELDAPVFTPHVTLYASTSHDAEDPEDILRKTAPNPIPMPTPIPLDFRGFGRSPRFTKTFYMELSPTFQLAAWTEQLRNASRNPSHYQLHPHLSLVYKKLSLLEQERLAGQVGATLLSSLAKFTGHAQSIHHIPFDEARIVFAPDDIKSKEDVECWQDFASISLT